MATIINLGDPDTPGHEGPYPLAVFFAISSFAIALLLTPPFVSHLKNRNVGASALVLTTIISDMFSFLNAIIWSNDDIPNWYTGAGLCDVEIKLAAALQVVLPAAIAMVLRGLAQVMNTNSSSWSATSARKRRNVIIDLVCCVGLPMFQMLFQWISQPFRYYILGIAGCTAPTDGSWLGYLLTFGPQVAWTVVCGYYSVILLIRLVRYRRAFNTIMANNNTTKSRFLRLYLLATLLLLGFVPAQIYILYENFSLGILPFSWNATHHPTEYSWQSVVMLPSHGSTYYDRWFWLGGSVLIFAFFGFGRDAVKTYREILLAAGVGRVIPILKPGYESRRDTLGTLSSMGSKARLYFGKRKDSGSVTTSATDSMRSPTLVSATDYGYSPKREGFQQSEKVRSPTAAKGGFLAAWFGKTARKLSINKDPFVLTTYNQQAMIQSNISAEPMSPNSVQHGHSFSRDDVVVRTEVRQASETVEPVLGKKLYEGV